LCHIHENKKPEQTGMVTIKEIAKAVGVSSATVSRVLNYDPALSISAVKRQAIIETAEALNYETPRNRNRANGPVAAPSVLSRLAIIHFLEPSDEIADPYYVGVRLGIENRCRDFKTEITKVFHSDMLPDAELLESMSGVIVIGKHSDSEINWFIEHARHVVFADFDPRVEAIDSVFSDTAHATRKILGASSGGVSTRRCWRSAPRHPARTCGLNPAISWRSACWRCRNGLM
jgi:LacI family transcriptional regulator